MITTLFQKWWFIVSRSGLDCKRGNPVQCHVSRKQSSVDLHHGNFLSPNDSGVCTKIIERTSQKYNWPSEKVCRVQILRLNLRNATLAPFQKNFSLVGTFLQSTLLPTITAGRLQLASLVLCKWSSKWRMSWLHAPRVPSFHLVQIQASSMDS